MKTKFHIDDRIIAKLRLPDECPITTEIKEKERNLILHVGPRDWQWDLDDGHLVGMGTCTIEAKFKEPPCES